MSGHPDMTYKARMLSEKVLKVFTGRPMEHAMAELRRAIADEVVALVRQELESAAALAERTSPESLGVGPWQIPFNRGQRCACQRISKALRTIAATHWKDQIDPDEEDES